MLYSCTCLPEMSVINPKSSGLNMCEVGLLRKLMCLRDLKLNSLLLSLVSSFAPYVKPSSASCPSRNM